MNWISVDERLPEEDVEVFVWSPTGGASICYRPRDDGRWWSPDEGIFINNRVTHWAPIEPPEEDEFWPVNLDDEQPGKPPEDPDVFEALWTMLDQINDPSPERLERVASGKVVGDVQPLLARAILDLKAKVKREVQELADFYVVNKAEHTTHKRRLSALEKVDGLEVGFRHGAMWQAIKIDEHEDPAHLQPLLELDSRLCKLEGR